jgi:magnesium transporter
MREELQERLEEIENQFFIGNLKGVKDLLEDCHEFDLAEMIENLELNHRIVIFRLLQKDQAVEVFEHLELESQTELLHGFSDVRIISMVNEMSPDDRARLFDELPATVVRKLLSQMTREEWDATSVLLGFRDNTAGRIMTPEYVALKKDITVEEALKWIKKFGHNKETIYYSYVIDETRRLLGVISLRDIVLADSETKIIDLIDMTVIKVTTEEDQEVVAQVISDYDLLAVPVVDKEERLVGIVTVDDVMDVVEEEATEDMLRMGGVEIADKGYFKSSIVKNFSKRIIWLLFLLGLYTVSGQIIISEKSIIEKMVILSAFIPSLVGTGGNAGTQSSTVVIRGLAIGEIELKDVLWVYMREAVIGIVLGISLGMMATLWAYTIQGSWGVALTVGLSALAIISFSTTLGTLLPIAFKRLGFDPAFMATPFITSAVDITSLLIYFAIARYILNL